MIVDALQQVGAARSIVIDERNEVLAGNGVVQAAAAAGITRVRVIDAPGDTLIAVRRRGLTAAQKRDLALYDNRTGELAEWNAPQLEADLQAGVDLTPFFTDKELASLLHRQLENPADLGGASTEQFIIVVTCANEAEQTALLDRLMKEGHTCRAVVS